MCYLLKVGGQVESLSISLQTWRISGLLIEGAMLLSFINIGIMSLRVWENPNNIPGVLPIIKEQWESPRVYWKALNVIICKNALV